MVVYGYNGISILTPTAEPVSTMGLRDVFNSFGINNKGAAGGDDQMHVFLDSEGELWSIDSKGPKKLGYKEWFSDNLDLEWIVSLDPHEREFYISNGVETFVLTQWGLSSVKQLVTSIGYRDEFSMCLGSELTDTTVRLVSDEIDGGTNEIQTLQWIKVGANKTAKYKVAVDYKYEDDENWTRSELLEVSVEGVAYPNIAAKSFRIVVEADTEYDINSVEAPDYVTYTFKNTDRRYTRGINIARLSSAN